MDSQRWVQQVGGSTDSASTRKRQRNSAQADVQSKKAKVFQESTTRRPRGNHPPENSQTAAAKPSYSTRNPKVEQSVLLVIDGGTENTKAAYLIRKVTNGVKERLQPDDLRPVIWPGESMSIRSQMAYQQTTDPSNGDAVTTQLVGNEVDDALAKGEIEEMNITRHKKPMLFQGSFAARKVAGPFLERMFERLSLKPDLRKTKAFLSIMGDPSASRGVELEVDRYGQLLQWILRRCLRYISEHHPELVWSELKHDEACDAFLRRKPNLIIGLPVPAKCTDQDNRRIVAAANLAGIDHPHLISGPVAALMHNLLEKRMRNISVLGTKFLVLDHGAGSADFAIMSVKGVEIGNGLMALDIVEEVPSETRWCGGAEANNVAAGLLLQELAIASRKPLKSVLKTMRRNRILGYNIELQSCKDPTRRSRLQSSITKLEEDSRNL